MWTAIGQAFSMVFEPYTLMVMVAAAFYGLFVGAVPGLTATMATALLVPVTFFMPPIPAIAAMVTATMRVRRQLTRKALNKATNMMKLVAKNPRVLANAM